MHWMLLPFKRYADFGGRSRRMEFWMFQVFNLIVGAILAGPFYFSFAAASLAADPAISGNDEISIEAVEAMFSGVGVIGWAGIGLFSIYALAVLIPALALGVALTVRRFHDRDMSGWWYLGFIAASLIPVIGIIASIALVVLFFLPGTAGPNRFGPDPKSPDQIGVFQ